jgi:voltage-gated potassium channel
MRWHREPWLLQNLGRFGRRPVRNTLLYLVGVVAVAAGVYSVAEGREVSYVDGLWWSIVTLTTVGYGDIAPASAGMRMVAVWVMASGLLGVAVVTGALAARMSVAALADADSTPGIDDDFDALSADLADAVDRVRHLQERFRLDELGDDRLAAAAREVIAHFERGDLRPAVIGRLKEVLDRQHATDA